MIDAVPLSEELSGENASTNPDNSENAPINVENAPIIAESASENCPKKRGRPAGVKDAAKRKTPVRQKKAVEPAAPPPPPVIEAVSAPARVVKATPAPKKPKPQQIVENTEMPPEPQLTAAQLLRHLQNERRAHLDDHWSKVIGPMFVR